MRIFTNSKRFNLMVEVGSMWRRSILALAGSFVFGAVLCAQTASSANTSKLVGTVSDATGGVMVNLDVQLTTGTPPRVVASGKTNSDGEFEMSVVPGQYTLKISVPDFKDVSQQVRVTPDMAPLAITMALSITTQVNVTTTSDSNEVSVDPNSSLNTDVITGDALLDLPDNPDDLLAYLLQLAQLRGGEGDVTINVDGFNGADIPPLAQIAEIRIVKAEIPDPKYVVEQQRSVDQGSTKPECECRQQPKRAGRRRSPRCDSRWPDCKRPDQYQCRSEFHVVPPTENQQKPESDDVI
jgi:Carboxypeptidase regulatory-like domain